MPDTPTKGPRARQQLSAPATQTMHGRDWGDVFSGGLLFLIGCAMLTNALGIEKKLPIGVGSGFVPVLIAIGLIATAASIVYRGLRPSPIVGISKKTRRLAALPVLGTAGLLALYTVSIDLVGFAVSTTLYLTAQMALLTPRDQRHWFRLGLIGVIATSLIYVTFKHVFGLVLPTGLLV